MVGVTTYDQLSVRGARRVDAYLRCTSWGLRFGVLAFLLVSSPKLLLW